MSGSGFNVSVSLSSSATGTQSAYVPLTVVDPDGTPPTLAQVGGGSVATVTAVANTGPSSATYPYALSVSSIAGQTGSLAVSVSGDGTVNGTLTVGVSALPSQVFSAGTPVIGAFGAPPVTSF